MFFNLRVVSKSPAEISTPIGAVLELCSRANLPCLVKLSLVLLSLREFMFYAVVVVTRNISSFIICVHTKKSTFGF